jgi:hypothetical protein
MNRLSEKLFSIFLVISLGLLGWNFKTTQQIAEDNRYILKVLANIEPYIPSIIEHEAKLKYIEDRLSDIYKGHP